MGNFPPAPRQGGVCQHDAQECAGLRAAEAGAGAESNKAKRSEPHYAGKNLDRHITTLHILTTSHRLRIIIPLLDIINYNRAAVNPPSRRTFVFPNDVLKKVPEAQITGTFFERDTSHKP